MSELQPTKREIPWGNSAIEANIAEPADGQKLSGWTGTPAPPYQWFNWILRQAGKWIEYLRARGIPDYDATETYRIGDVVQYTDGLTYRRHAGSNSQGIAPSNGSYWERWGHNATQLNTEVDAHLATHVTDADALVTTATSGASVDGAEIQYINGKKRMTYNAGKTGAGHVQVDLSGAADFVPRILTWSIGTSDDIATAQIKITAHTQTIYVSGVGDAQWLVSVVAEE
jgi:hypothetical protein